MTFFIVGAAISMVILIATLLVLRSNYLKKKDIFEKSRKDDEKLKNIDFKKNEDYFKNKVK